MEEAMAEHQEMASIRWEGDVDLVKLIDACLIIDDTDPEKKAAKQHGIVRKYKLYSGVSEQALVYETSELPFPLPPGLPARII